MIVISRARQLELVYSDRTKGSQETRIERINIKGSISCGEDVMLLRLLVIANTSPRKIEFGNFVCDMFVVEFCQEPAGPKGDGVSALALSYRNVRVCDERCGKIDGSSFRKLQNQPILVQDEMTSLPVIESPNSNDWLKKNPPVQRITMVSADHRTFTADVQSHRGISVEERRSLNLYGRILFSTPALKPIHKFHHFSIKTRFPELQTPYELAIGSNRQTARMKLTAVIVESICHALCIHERLPYVFVVPITCPDRWQLERVSLMAFVRIDIHLQYHLVQRVRLCGKSENHPDLARSLLSHP